LLSLMAASFVYLILVLLAFLDALSLSCPNSVRCGNIGINYPFFENTTGSQKCGGKFAIECNGSSAMLQFEGVNYPVLNISYPERVVTIQDLMLSQYSRESRCSFLYDFTVGREKYYMEKIREEQKSKGAETELISNQQQNRSADRSTGVRKRAQDSSVDRSRRTVGRPVDRLT